MYLLIEMYPTTFLSRNCLQWSASMAFVQVRWFVFACSIVILPSGSSNVTEPLK